MARCNCNATSASGCQCSMTDSDCFSIGGAGSDSNPFYVEANLDSDAENLLECSADGLAAFLPPEIAEPPRCQIIRTVDFPVQTATVQFLSFDLLPVYDTANMYDSSTNDMEMTIQMDGLYVVHCQVGWEETAADAYASFAVVQLPSNTELISTALVISPGPGNPMWRTHASNDWELNAGDTLAVKVYQNTGADLNVIGARLTARRVAPLSSGS